MDYVGELALAVCVAVLVVRYRARRRALEEQMRRFSDVAVDLHCRASFDGFFLSMNPAGRALLGYDEHELLSRPFLELVHPDDRERTIAETERLAYSDAQTVNFQNRYVTRGGHCVWLAWTARAVLSDGVIYASARDVTAERDQQAALERKVAERTDDIQAASLETLRRLADVAEFRDDTTHRHTARVGELAAAFAERLGLGDEMVENMRRAAPLHDIGKLGVADAILLKPGRLTDGERAVMQRHTTIGATILSGSGFPILQLGEQIALTHHERWDGTGYPAGLAGQEIPIAGRIVAVADVFDALTHARPYKAAWSLEDAVAEIIRGAGSQFDPAVVAAFTELWGERVPPLRRYISRAKAPAVANMNAL